MSQHYKNPTRHVGLDQNRCRYHHLAIAQSHVNAASSIPIHGGLYSIKLYVIKCVSDGVRSVAGCLKNESIMQISE